MICCAWCTEEGKLTFENIWLTLNVNQSILDQFAASSKRPFGGRFTSDVTPQRVYREGERSACSNGLSYFLVGLSERAVLFCSR